MVLPPLLSVIFRPVLRACARSECQLQLSHTLIAIGRIFFETAKNDGFKVGRKIVHIAAMVAQLAA